MLKTNVLEAEGDVRQEIAAILAKGVLAYLQRFRRSEVLPMAKSGNASESPRPSRRTGPRRLIRRAVSESGPNRLEVPSETRPTVHAG